MNAFIFCRCSWLLLSSKCCSSLQQRSRTWSATHAAAANKCASQHGARVLIFLLARYIGTCFSIDIVPCHASSACGAALHHMLPFEPALGCTASGSWQQGMSALSECMLASSVPEQLMLRSDIEVPCQCADALERAIHGCRAAACQQTTASLHWNGLFCFCGAFDHKRLHPVRNSSAGLLFGDHSELATKVCQQPPPQRGRP